MYLVNPHRFGRTLAQAIAAAGLGANLRLALDAGDADSYTSGQKWLDTSGNGYDFHLGTTSGAEASDPTFNGAAGGKSSGEYWGFDGGDLFRYDAANETWMQNIHKNNAAYTILAAIYIPDSGGFQGFAGTAPATGSNIGFRYRVNLGGERQDIGIGNATGTPVLSVQADAALAVDAWHVVAVSINEAAGAGGGFFYRDGAYDQVSGADTFNPTYVSPSASNATFTMEIGATGNANQILASGARMAAFAAWEGAALSKASLDTLYALIRGRWGL